MKIKWFSVSFCFLFMAFACSMENENVLVGIEQGKGNVENVDANVNVSLTEGNFTKTAVSMPESELKNAIIFLIDAGGDVETFLCINDSPQLKEPISFCTKKAIGKSVYVVANVSPATQTLLRGEKNLDGIKAVPLTASDLALLPKVSEELIPLTFEKSTSGDGAYLAEVNTTLLQRTARVQLKSLTFAFDDKSVKYSDLKLTSVAFSNVVATGLVEGVPFLKETVAKENILQLASSGNQFQLEDDLYIDTYANNNTEVPTTLHLSFTMDGGKKKLSTLCTVKTEGQDLVRAGHKYELHLKAIISSDEIRTSVTWMVEDIEKVEDVDIPSFE